MNDPGLHKELLFALEGLTLIALQFELRDLDLSNHCL